MDLERGSGLLISMSLFMYRVGVVLRCTVKTHEVCKNQHSPKVIAKTGSYINGKSANI